MPSPLRVGWETARANVVPMVCLWLLALLLVVGYYRVPAVAALLEPLRAWQEESRWLAAAVNRSVFCIALPGLFILPMRSLRPERPFAVLLGQTAWGGICGLAASWMYSANAALFGTGIDFGTLAVKTAVCQFVWTPLFFVPAGAVVYQWLGHGLSLSRTRAEWPDRFLRTSLLPNLVANWCVWIPAIMLIHMFPTALQIQLSGLVGVFHGLLMLRIGRNGRGRSAQRSLSKRPKSTSLSM